MPLLRTLCRFPGLSDAVQPFLSSASQWLADTQVRSRYVLTSDRDKEFQEFLREWKQKNVVAVGNQRIDPSDRRNSLPKRDITRRPRGPIG